MDDPSGYKPWIWGSAHTAEAFPGWEIRSCPACVGWLPETLISLIAEASITPVPEKSSTDPLPTIKFCPVLTPAPTSLKGAITEVEPPPPDPPLPPEFTTEI